MSISGINSGQGLYQSNTTHKFTKIPALSTDAKINTHSTVNISEKAKELSQNNVLPVEAYAMPDWFGSMFPTESIANHSDADPQKTSNFTGEKKSAVRYCANTSIKYYQEEAQKTGISAAEAYYMKTSQPDQYTEYSDELHKSVRSRLLEDAQYMNYSALLGMTI